MKTQDLFQGFAYPKTNLQEVLLTLILKGNVTLFDFPVMAGYRTRVSNLVLKYGLSLETIRQKKKNQFGNTYTYHIHKLPADQKDKAIEIYNKIVTR